MRCGRRYTVITSYSIHYTKLYDTFCYRSIKIKLSNVKDADKMKSNFSTKWVSDMAFETEISGHKVLMDASEDVGGHDQGPRPKPLIIAALTGCTGMDVVSIRNNFV